MVAQVGVMLAQVGMMVAEMVTSVAVGTMGIRSSGLNKLSKLSRPIKVENALLMLMNASTHMKRHKDVTAELKPTLNTRIVVSSSESEQKE